ncbi:MAG: bifunctional riboflavin kinase/FAD synthetase [Hyphomicrobiaceae bacterium]|nr:bifunctional riboflavin kinase/FAD synthetase [Hyphomicrobiaceae bacterium]
MNVVHGYETLPPHLRGAAIAIGNFDGVHRGHQALIARARERAADAPRHGASHLAGAMVFEPHPREFFHPERRHFRLTTLEQKLALFERYGLDLTVVVPFDKRLAGLDAQSFVADVLVGGLNVGHVVIGYDFMFGRDRMGSARDIERAGAEMGFGVSVIPPVAEGGEVISSSAIRSEIAQGDVRGAAEMLGHWWVVAGEVVGGFKKGTGMGFPTANIVLPRSTPLAYGIYAVFVDALGRRHQGAAYLGTRPTFDNGPPVLEVFLFDFDADLYGKKIEVSFVEFIRPDKRFEGMEALVVQMDKDCAAARQLLAAAPDR